jgi:hypothetical protein
MVLLEGDVTEAEVKRWCSVTLTTVEAGAIMTPQQQTRRMRNFGGEDEIGETHQISDDRTMPANACKTSWTIISSSR